MRLIDENDLEKTTIMMNDRTKKTLYWTLAVIGLLLMLVGLICDTFSDWTNAIPESKWYKIAMLIGWPIIFLSAYFKPIEKSDIENNTGCSYYLLLIATFTLLIGWVSDIKNYSTGMNIAVASSVILMITCTILHYKRWQRIKAIEEEQENEKNQE